MYTIRSTYCPRHQVVRASLVTCLGIMVAGCNWVHDGSVSSTGLQANSDSLYPEISANGRFVAFQSRADNLVPGDLGGSTDVFLHDALTGSTSRVSVNNAGTGGDYHSRFPSLSADGRRVVFSSYASNLIVGDTNSAEDIFFHDTDTSTTTRVSVSSEGIQGNGASAGAVISSNSNSVAFISGADNLVASDSNGRFDIFVHDVDTGATNRMSVDSAESQANDSSFDPAISDSGRYVAFSSDATNLISNDNNGSRDIFVRDRAAGTTTRVSVDSMGNEAQGNSRFPSISGDGRYVVFESESSGLVAGDTNTMTDIFVHDRLAQTTKRVSVDSSGVQSDRDSGQPAISLDGRYIVFWSYTYNLVPGISNGKSDIYMHDQHNGETFRVSLDSFGAEANGSSFSPSLSGDGRYVAFSTSASNLVEGDTNSASDVVLRASLEVNVGSMTPNLLPLDSNNSVILTGSNFFPGAKVYVGGAQVQNVVVVDENTITLDVLVPESIAAPVANVSVSNFGTGAGLFSGVAGVCEDCVAFF